MGGLDAFFLDTGRGNVDMVVSFNSNSPSAKIGFPTTKNENSVENSHMDERTRNSANPVPVTQPKVQNSLQSSGIKFAGCSGSSEFTKSSISFSGTASPLRSSSVVPDWAFIRFTAMEPSAPELSCGNDRLLVVISL